jgi:kynurenine formamidase
MDKRVKFDFELTFTNGGSIQGQEFRLDVGGDTISNQELADYLVRDMNLLIVDRVCIFNKVILDEEHKRSISEFQSSDQRLIDLSHTIESGLVTYKGLPAPIICDYLSREKSREVYEPGTEFHIARIDMVANTGTYLDCPFHRYEDGRDLSELDPARLVDLEAVVVRADYRQSREIHTGYFENRDFRNQAVLVHTGWDQNWNTPEYFEYHPFLTEDAAVYLMDQGARLVGIDSMNIDDTRGRSRPVHSTLLRENILIVEHLRGLDGLPDEGFTFSAVPPKFKGVGTFPVRAYAKLK